MNSTSTAKKGSSARALKNLRKTKLMTLMRSLCGWSRGSDFWSSRIVLNRFKVDTCRMGEWPRHEKP